MLTVRLDAARPLVFDDGRPVRAASGVAPFDGGWLVVQDDAVHAALVRGRSVSRLRLLPAVGGREVFSAGRDKHLKPDLEAACPVEVGGRAGVLALGSASTPARNRAALVLPGREPQVRAADLGAVCARVAQALDRSPDALNLEGACVVGESLRWFARGSSALGVPSASVDVDLAALLDVFTGGCPAGVEVTGARSYDLGDVSGVALAVTDANALPDGRLLLAAAAEDAPNVVDDGPVVGSALVLVAGDEVAGSVPIPHVDGSPPKVEGLALLGSGDDGVRLLAVVDDDDDEKASLALVLHLGW